MLVSISNLTMPELLEKKQNKLKKKEKHHPLI